MPNRRFAVLTVLAAALGAGLSHAQAWPSKPIRLIVAYPAGGGLDFVGRTIAQRLSETLGQQVLVDNRGGASGAIGADLVAKAPADGYTILLASPAEVVVGAAAGQKTPYNPETDLMPVALVGDTPLVIVAHPSIPGATIKEVAAYAKSNPGKLSYGTPGNGSSMHFAGESLKSGLGLFMTHIPYRGAAPAINDTLGNQVNISVVGMPPVVAHVRSGKLKALAVTTIQRSATMPTVPTVAELPGMSGYQFTNWMGLFAPANTPAAVVQRIGNEIASIVKEQATRERLAGAGVDALGLQGADFASFLDAERKRYKAIAQERNIRFGD